MSPRDLLPQGFRIKTVIKRDGREVEFDAGRIWRAISKAMVEVGKYDEGKLRDVVEDVLITLNETFDRPPHVEEIQDIIEITLMKHDLFEVAKAYILYRKERERERKEKMAILGTEKIDKVTKKLSVNAVRLLAARYLLKDPETGKIVETPRDLFVRVASLAVIPDFLYDPKVYDPSGSQPPRSSEIDVEVMEVEGDPGDDLKPAIRWNKHHLERMRDLFERLSQKGHMKKDLKEIVEMIRKGELDHYQDFLRYFQLMADLQFMPNSPTLFNAGTSLGQLSACFVLDIQDSLDSIMKAAWDAAKIFQSGGGIGINYSNLRPEGDVVRSTNGVASGPVSFMRIIDVMTDVVKQGGRRRGANMGILEVWHPDIRKFVEAKATEGRLTNFNISVMLDSEFWEKYEKGEKYPLRNPRDGKIWDEIDPREFFEYLAEMAWKTGDPGVLFKDNINRRNMMREHLGEIRATNPCVSGDTPVLTPLGWIRAEELYRMGKMNGEVRGVEGEGEGKAYRVEVVGVEGEEVVYRTVHGEELRLLVPRGSEAWVWKVGRKKGLRVVTKEGYEVVVTREHRFLTEKGWKEARELREGDKIRIGRIHPAFLERLGGLEVDEDVAFALGWLVGDGTLNKHYVAWFFGPGDKAAEERVRRGIEKLGGNPLSHTYTLSATEHKVQYNKGTKVYGNVVEFVGEMERSRERRVPEVVWKFSPRSLSAFLRGLFTADGYVDQDKAVRLTSASLSLLKDVQVLLTTLGIRSTIYHRPYSHKFTYTTSSGEEREYEAGEYYELVITGYSRKLFKEIIGFESIEKLEKLSLAKTKRDSPWATVERVEEVEAEFYDFTVPILHTYLAGGVLHHNCGEEPLYPYESCNLGSINLYAYIERLDGNAEFKWEEFARDVKTALRLLDNIIDVNKFPLPEIEENTRATRKVGLGLMGLADTLFALGIPYNSEEGFEFMRKVAEWLTYHALWESTELAKERGVFPLYEKSLYPKGEMPVEGYYHREWWTLDWAALRKRIDEHGVRNAEVTTIAPTGSISMICDTSSGIEPQFALVYEKRVTVGSFFYVDNELRFQLRRRGLYAEKLLKEISDNGGSLQGLDVPEDMKRVFVVAYDIPWWDHVRAQGEITKWICAAVSKTINMPKWVSPKDVEKAYLFAHKLGLKGITVYRDGSKAEQVLVTPSQREGRYVLDIGNNTLKIMEIMGIELPSLEEKKEPLMVFKVPRTGGKKKTCPVCGSERLVFKEDCVTCLDCGWSECIIS